MPRNTWIVAKIGEVHVAQGAIIYSFSVSNQNEVQANITPPPFFTGSYFCLSIIRRLMLDVYIQGFSVLPPVSLIVVAGNGLGWCQARWPWSSLPVRFFQATRQFVGLWFSTISVWWPPVARSRSGIRTYFFLEKEGWFLVWLTWVINLLIRN